MEISRGSRLLALAQVRLAPALERVLKTAWGVRVQRLGTQALKRVAARFPALAELLDMRGEAQRQAALGSTAQRAAVVSDAAVTKPLAPLATLLDRLAHGAAWQDRAGAAADLARVDADDAVEPLLRALQDPSAEVAAAAIDSLARFRGVRVTAALERVLRNRDGYFSPITRAAAVHGLARGASDGELEPVVQALSDLDAEVSLAAIAALGEYAPAALRRNILPLIEDRSGYFLPFVRLAAVNALVRSGRLEHDIAIRLRRSEADPSIRGALEQVITGAVRA
jgi:HEAT repeat protein